MPCNVSRAVCQLCRVAFPVLCVIWRRVGWVFCRVTFPVLCVTAGGARSASGRGGRSERGRVHAAPLGLHRVPRLHVQHVVIGRARHHPIPGAAPHGEPPAAASAAGSGLSGFPLLSRGMRISGLRLLSGGVGIGVWCVDGSWLVCVVSH